MQSHADVPTSEIVPDPDRPRHTLSDMDRFTETVRAHGVLWPITVVAREAFVKARPRRAGVIPRTASYVAIFGHRRLEAARRVGLERVPAVIRAMPQDLDEMTLLENTHRDKLSPLEEARIMGRMVENGWKQKDIAHALQMTPAAVSHRLSLLQLIPALQAALEDGTMKYRQVRSLGRLTPHEQARLLP